MDRNHQCLFDTLSRILRFSHHFYHNMHSLVFSLIFIDDIFGNVAISRRKVLNYALLRFQYTAMSDGTQKSFGLDNWHFPD